MLTDIVLTEEEIALEIEARKVEASKRGLTYFYADDLAIAGMTNQELYFEDSELPSESDLYLPSLEDNSLINQYWANAERLRDEALQRIR